MNEQLEEEITSINAIYDQETIHHATSSESICILTLPSRPEISLRLDFAQDYPDSPPSILGTESSGANVAKGDGQQLVELLRNVLSEVYTPGAPCIFDLVEETSARLEQLGLSASQEAGPEADAEHGQQNHDLDTTHSDGVQQQDSVLMEDPPWVFSEVVTEKRSVFVARVATVSSPQLAKQYLQHLLATDKKVAKATHNITAWRIKADGGVQYQDCDDDGETAAGGRLLHLLELMDVWSLMVVVTRWYGGVHLGPDRFRIINQVARDAIVKAGFAGDTSKKPKK